jgi:hypothetical protein
VQPLIPRVMANSRAKIFCRANIDNFLETRSGS